MLRDDGSPGDSLSGDGPMLVAGTGRDAAWVLLSLLAAAGSALVILGYAVRTVGPLDYGLYVVVVAILALSTVVDFAVSPLIVRATAIVCGPFDDRAVEDAKTTIASLHTLLFVLGATTAAAAAPMGRLIPVITKVPVGHGRSLFWTTVFLTLATSLSLATAAFPGALRGARHFRTVTVAGVVGSVVRVLLVLVLLRRMGLVAFGLAHLCSVAAERIILVLSARTSLPGLHFHLTRAEWTTTKKLAAFALPLAVLAVDSQIVSSSDAVVIGAFVGPAANALYKAGSLLPSQALQGLYRLLGVALPTFSALPDESEQHAVLQLFTRATSYLAGLGFTFVVVFRRDIVELLLGRTSRTAETILFLFSLSFLLDAMLHPMVLLLIARGRQRIMAVVAPVEIGLNLALTIVLVSAMGTVGAGVAALMSFSILDLVIFPIVARGEFATPPLRMIAVDGVVPAIVACSVCLVASVGGSALGHGPATRLTLGGSLVALAGTGAGLLIAGVGGRRQMRAALGVR